MVTHLLPQPVTASHLAQLRPSPVLAQAPLEPSDSDQTLRPPGLPSPLSVADNLVIRGNVIANRFAASSGRGEPDLGLQACTDDNPTCNPTQVRTQAAVRGSATAAAARARSEAVTLRSIVAAARALAAPAQVAAANSINQVTLSFLSNTALTLNANNKARIAGRQQPIPAFPAWATPLPTPAGFAAKLVPFDKAGLPRTAANSIPGAWI